MSLQRGRLILFISLWTLGLFGQDSEWQYIGLEEGLPSKGINNVVQGPAGFIWMASEGAGLIRYDGYSFETYFLEAFPVVEEVILSDSGRALFIHDGQRLARYNGLELDLIELGDHQQILDICDVKGSLYLALDDGLYHWISDSLHFKADLPEGFNRLASLQSNLWASTDSGAYYWNQQWKKQQRPIHLIGGQANAYYWQRGLYNLEGQSFIVSNQLPQSSSGLISYSQNDQYIFLSSDSLYWVDMQDSASYLTAHRVLPSSIDATKISGLFINHGQVVLISDQGLIKAPNFFQAYDENLAPIVSLELDGVPYIGTPRGLESPLFQNQLLATNGLVFGSEHIGDSLFVATESGLYYRPYFGAALKQSPVNGFVFSLAKQGSTLWAASSSGIWQLRDGHWSLEKDAASLAFASIFSAKYHSRSGLWFATYTKGLWHYRDGAWKNIQELAGVRLDSIGLSAMQPLSGDRLAVGTLSDGLYIFDLAREQVEHFRLKDLEFAEIRAFAVQASELWLGTNKGLLSFIDIVESRKAGESGQLHFVGLPVNGGSMQIQDSKLYAGGEKGLFSWALDWHQKAHPSGQLDLLEAEFLQDEGNMELEAYATKPFSGMHLLSDLDYDQNYLRFRFGTRSLYRPDLIQYRYRLQGQSEKWTYTGTNREALFSDLKAGTFSLEVQARYPWQSWTMQAPIYTFEIQQAVWRTYWFWIIIGAALLFLFYLYINDRWQKQRERLKLENDLLEMERKALRLQMNPHFIFNALDSISSFIFKKDPKMAVRYLNNFAKLMRLTLESSMEHIHPVETEVSILKNYLELEKLRFSGKFDYEIEVDEELDYSVGLPPMLIQPHVENAILHGLKPKKSQGFLKISFVLDDDILCCTIEDDGIGRDKAKELPNKKAHRSMATKINRDRIDLLRKSVDDVVDLKIEDKFNQQGEATGTKVMIRLPAQEL